MTLHLTTGDVMMIDKHIFFDSVRLRIFVTMSQQQTDGCNALIDSFDGSDARHLAYMLATAYLETAHTMQPVKEYGGSGYFVKRYWLNTKVAKQLGNLSDEDAVNFCGRGYVQLTGRVNYTIFSHLLGIDLINQPDLALDPVTASEIMTIGMTEGLFTGKKLVDYFSETSDDWVNARRIVNGTNQAVYIADKGQKFFDAITVK